MRSLTSTPSARTLSRPRFPRWASRPGRRRPASVEHASCGWYLERADGLRLFLSGPNYEHRDAFKFLLSAPTRKKGRSYVDVYDPQTRNRIPHPSIKVGAGKDPAQMAKDIGRRLLPEAERVHGLVVATLAKEEDAEAGRLKTLEALCAELGMPIPRDHYSKEPVFSGRMSGPSERLEFEVDSADAVTLKFYNLSQAMALRIAEFYAGQFSAT